MYTWKEDSSWVGLKLVDMSHEEVSITAVVAVLRA